MKGTGSAVEAVLRTVQTLEVLRSVAPGTLRATDLARTLGVDVSTASRLLTTLVTVGYAARTTSRQYALGPKVIHLAQGGWIDPLIKPFRAGLRKVAAAMNQTVHITQRVGDRVVICARVEKDEHTVSESAHFEELPLWASAAGKALLTLVPAVPRVALLPPVPYPAFTDRTLVTWEALRATLEQGAKRGVFEAHGEFDTTLSGFARLLLAPNGEAFAAYIECPIADKARHTRIRKALAAV